MQCYIANYLMSTAINLWVDLSTNLLVFEKITDLGAKISTFSKIKHFLKNKILVIFGFEQPQKNILFLGDSDSKCEISSQEFTPRGKLLPLTQI